MHLENSSLVCQRARVAIRKGFAICALLGLVGCKNLGAAGWQSTLDHTVAVDDKPTMIFRNPAKDMLTLSFYGAAGGKKLGTSIRFQSAAETAERDRKIQEQAPALRAAAKA